MTIWVAAFVSAACTADDAGPEPSGTVRVELRSFSGSEIATVDVTAEPSGTSVIVSAVPDGSPCSAVLSLPSGEYTLTAVAYRADGVASARGAAHVLIRSGQTTGVVLELFEILPPPPDHGPLITSVFATKSIAAAGEQLTLSATGVDPDGDALEWMWDSTCSPDRLLTPAAAVTAWSSARQGTCTLTVTLTANGLADSETVEVLIVPGDGLANVSVTYQPSPLVTSVELGTGAGCSVSRDSPNATCATTAAPGERVAGRVTFEIVSEPADTTVEVSDDCGGAVELSVPVFLDSSGSRDFQWTPPRSSGTVCLLRAAVTSAGLTDALSIAVLVDAPTVGDVFALTSANVTPYRDGKRAAASYTWDDGPPSSFTIAAVFEAYAMRATFNVIAGSIGDDAAWARWRGVVERGHDVGNHTMTHAHLGSASDEELSYEINGAQRVLTERLGVRPAVFAFPYSEFSARAAAIALQSHIATREAGPFAAPGLRLVPVGRATTASELNVALANAIDDRVWLVTAGHGVDVDGWDPMSSQVLRDHLAFAGSRRADLWVDTFRNVAAYKLARDRVRPDVTVVSPRQLVVQLWGALNGALAEAVLTVELPLRRPLANIRATDAAGNEVPVVISGDALRFDLRVGDAVRLELPSAT